MNAQTFSSEELRRRTLERRAVEAVIWGMPIVSVHATSDAQRRYLLNQSSVFRQARRL